MTQLEYTFFETVPKLLKSIADSLVDIKNTLKELEKYRQ